MPLSSYTTKINLVDNGLSVLHDLSEMEVGAIKHPNNGLGCFLMCRIPDLSISKCCVQNYPISCFNESTSLT